MSFDKNRGFTLVELLVGLVLGGLFAIVLFNFVSGQARFTQIQDARQEVQQNTRGAIELMMSELRAVPGDGIVNASATSVEIRVPRIWGVLCGPVAGNRVNMVTPPDVAEGAVFPTDYSLTTTWGLAIQDSTVTNRALYATSALQDTARYAGTDCGTMGASLAVTDTSPARALQVNVTGTPQRTDGAAHPGGAGSIAFLYQTVRYDVGSSSVAPGSWLRRRVLSGSATPQPVAGPLSASDANPLSFTFLCGANAIDASVAANRPFVTGIRIAVAMQSRPSTRNVLQVERDTVTVHLRNSGAVTCP